ncbi:ABC transporter substrate-binding protein [Georgenia sp. H159]|uniref:ABC transporter substrate-binding protein n=1 Tax=Georgenia sp. H159 TaxID=3076115 RepID=UPI002D793600|nr:ABC transporter substrate-binding protein [Georgenia sp. H159]
MRRRSTAAAAAAAFLGTTLALAACGGSNGGDNGGGATPDAGTTQGAEGEGSLTDVQVGATTTVQAATAHLGVSEGFFEDEGLDVEVSVIQAAASAIPSLLNGELHYTLLTSVPLVTAISNGMPIAMALGNDLYETEEGLDDLGIVVRQDSGIASAADLNGKSIAIVALRSAPELATRVALDEAGGDSSTVTFVEIPYPEMAGAIAQGRVDAGLLAPPFFGPAVNESDELASIMHPFPVAFPGGVGGTWAASRDFLENNADTAEAFARAMGKAAEFANQNPDATREAIASYSPIDPEALATVPLTSYSIELPEDDVTRMIDAMVTYGFIEEPVDVADVIWPR